MYQGRVTLPTWSIPSFISARVEGMEVERGGGPGGLFPMGGSRVGREGKGQLESVPSTVASTGHSVSWSTTPHTPSPRPSGQEGPEWALRGRREPVLYLLSQGIPSPPKKTAFRKPPPGDEGHSPTLGSPSLSLVGGEAGAKAHLLQDRMVCHQRHSRPGGERKKNQPSY